MERLFTREKRNKEGGVIKGITFQRDVLKAKLEVLKKYGCKEGRNIKKVTLEQRFWDKVIKTDECWYWLGAKKGRGYGHIWLNGHMLAAHRIAWILSYGEIPLGTCVLHKCDNPACVNPSHLFLGNNLDNTLDMVAKKRHYYGETHYNAKLTEEDILNIRNSPLSNAELARIYPVSFQQISKIRKFLEWREVAI